MSGITVSWPDYLKKFKRRRESITKQEVSSEPIELPHLDTTPKASPLRRPRVTAALVITGSKNDLRLTLQYI